jgi:VWFA-related protein
MRLFACALAAALATQQTPTPSAPPTFRATTDLVEVDVSAIDRNSRFVPNLHADDFELREDGAPQSVELMYIVSGSGGSSSTSAVPAVVTASNAPSAATQPPRAPRVFVAFLDTDHLSNGGFKRVQAAALDLFSKEFKAGDVGGVLFDRHLYKDRLTVDREELLAGVKSARPNSHTSSRKFDETVWPRLSAVEAVEIVLRRDDHVRAMAIERACLDDPCDSPVKRQMAELGVASKAQQLAAEAQADTATTMQTVLTLLRGLGRFDGRKTILFLTEGFLADQSWPLVRDAIGEAARVNARMYTLDARGLDRTGMAEQLAGAFPGDTFVGLNMLKAFDFSDDAMNSLAVDTGGFVVRNQNYFDRAVAQIVADASTYYVLGYRSTKAPDGKFRSISVKVKRKGVLVRARRGYVATARPAAVMTDAGAPTAATEPVASAPEPVAPVAAAPESTPTPADAATAPAAEPAAPSAATTTPNAMPANGLRVRPDAGKHVDLLLKDEAGDAAAKAGWDAYQRGDVATARASLAVAAASASAHPWIHYALGMSEYALRQYKDAATEWELVRRAEPGFEPVYFDLVDSYLSLREHDEAIKVLRAGRDRWPKDPDVLNALGVVQTLRGAIDDAVKSFQGAVTVAPNDHVSRYNLGRALEMRYNRTRRYIRQQQRWVSNERDREDAIANYKAAVDIGGPFKAEAEEGLTRLNWTPKA